MQITNILNNPFSSIKEYHGIIDETLRRDIAENQLPSIDLLQYVNTRFNLFNNPKHEFQPSLALKWQLHFAAHSTRIGSNIITGENFNYAYLAPQDLAILFFILNSFQAYEKDSKGDLAIFPTIATFLELYILDLSTTDECKARLVLDTLITLDAWNAYENPGLSDVAKKMREKIIDQANNNKSHNILAEQKKTILSLPEEVLAKIMDFAHMPELTSRICLAFRNATNYPTYGFNRLKIIYDKRQKIIDTSLIDYCARSRFILNSLLPRYQEPAIKKLFDQHGFLILQLLDTPEIEINDQNIADFLQSLNLQKNQEGTAKIAETTRKIEVGDALMNVLPGVIGIDALLFGDALPGEFVDLFIEGVPVMNILLPLLPGLPLGGVLENSTVAYGRGGRGPLVFQISEIEKEQRRSLEVKILLDHLEKNTAIAQATQLNITPEDLLNCLDIQNEKNRFVFPSILFNYFENLEVLKITRLITGFTPANVREPISLQAPFVTLASQIRKMANLKLLHTPYFKKSELTEIKKTMPLLAIKRDRY